ncbi:long chain acyl-CoA synthetase 6, peroxisomal [Artemisia annua]|uniref:Long chain acyl-CoA synthetase 6, peroxisomal n=1 Tax=Artemisia annua TaxID=35608 RepID=A0A2U1P6U3_ARTAN|nr:long chain acyl-CoA synthetase 6, peroxisomal [Artemisia annua]
MESKSQRRIQVIQKHFLHEPDTSSSVLRPYQTAGEYFLEQGYSVVLPEKLQTGKWNVYRSAFSPLKLVSRYRDHPEIATLHDNFVHAVETYGDYKYLGTRVGVDGTVGEYKWMTYREAGPDAVKFIVNHADVQVVFCVPQTLKDLLSYLSEVPSVRLIVGQEYPKPFCPPKPENIATLCYTSGTTGKPKGAVVSHGNLIANNAGQAMRMKFYPSDIYISYLPLAHIFERSTQVMLAYFGVGIGFGQGVSNLPYNKVVKKDSLKLMDDMVSLRPTVFFGVPRVFNRLYASITGAVQSSGVLRQRLFNAAYDAKRQAILDGIVVKLILISTHYHALSFESVEIVVAGMNSSAMWDTLVFNKIKGMLGGRVRFILSAASPLSPDVLEFLRVCFGCVFLEGYGMTENSCVISNMDFGDNLCGHVGSPCPACEIKLVDVPEMDYTSADQPHPRGEICTRGPTVFQGYYKDEVQTREIIDEDGWLHTGDIGLWLPEGRLKIIDRKKNIFKLSQGEYVAAEKIENVYVNSKFVAQCFVYGDSLKSSLVAIVSLDQDVFKAWAAAEGIKYKDLKQLCNDLRARAAVLADMTQVAKKAQLRGFECVKAVTLVVEPFTMENGLLTPTFKIKRPQAKAYFSKAIASMYTEISKSS